MHFKNQSKKLTLVLTLAFIAFLLFCGSLSAQTTLANLNGTITNEDGEGFPGATITLRNMESGYTYSTISRENGNYVLAGIQPGKYEIEVSLEGFTKQKRQGVTFAISSSVTINFKLSPATLEEEITVTAEAPMVEVTKSEVSSVVDREAIDNLPISDSSFEGWRSLAVMTPGVQIGRDVIANGQHVAYGDMIVDSVSNERVATGRPTSGVPDDVIREFRVITNLYQAEYGNSSGLVLSALTRSGTNEVKGRLSFYYRDESISDVGYFVNHRSYQGEEIPKGEYEKPPYEHYRYSGYVSGPIIKDKAHFLLSYEGLNRTSYTTITSPLVPHETVTVRQGNNQIFAKMNYQINEKNLFNFRYSLDRPTRENAGIGGYNTKDRRRDLIRNVHTLVGEWINYPSGNTMNELRIQYSYQKGGWEVPDPDAYSISRPSGQFGKAPNMEQWSKFPRYQINDNFSIFLANHQMKFGFDYSYSPWYFYIESRQPGAFAFDTDAPFDPDDFSTYPYRFAYTVGEPGWNMPYHQFGIFAQDKWKIHPRLSLNAGLRFSYYIMEGYDFDHWNIKNFNPRLGFSWDPVGDGKTAIRGGIGTYSANPSLGPANNIKSYQSLTTHVIQYPNYPDPFAPNPFFESQTREQTSSIWEAKEGLIYPYTLQTSLGFQREIFTDFSASIDFVMAKGYHMYRRENLNPIIPGTRYKHVDPSKGDWWLIVDEGKSDYKGLYLTLKKAFSKGWGFDIAYTLSKAMTDTESESTTPDNYEDPENLRMWGPSNSDRRHILSVFGIFNLPFGFQATGLLNYSSAGPWNATYRQDINQDGLRSDYLDEYRNSRRGFDHFNINTRISKFINIKKQRIRLFIEIYNVTNRVNFGSIYNKYPSNRFGEPTRAGSPRQIQLGARWSF